MWDWYYDFEFDYITRLIVYTGIMDSDLWHIIAAENLENIKGIKLLVDDTLISDKALIHDLLSEVTFEEVEVEEHEDYYLVKL